MGKGPWDRLIELLMHDHQEESRARREERLLEQRARWEERKATQQTWHRVLIIFAVAIAFGMLVAGLDRAGVPVNEWAPHFVDTVKAVAGTRQ